MKERTPGVKVAFFITKRIFFSALIIVLIIIGNAIISIHGIRVVNNAHYNLSKSLKISNKTEILLRTITDAETGGRGYIISGNNKFLAPYDSALISYPFALADLKSLTTEDAFFSARLDTLELFIHNKLDLISGNINLFNTNGFEEAKKEILSEKGLKQMEQIRDMVDILQDHEKNNYDALKEAAREATNEIFIAYVISTIISILLLLLAYFLIRSDLTNRIIAEKELKRSNAGLEQFAYVVSHDLQEPLRAISSFTRLLELKHSQKMDGEAKEFFRFIIEGATRMQLLINNLLEYSRINTKQKTLGLINLNTVLDHLLISMQPIITETKTIVLVDHLPSLLVDETQMTQLFQNLLSNAIKFRGTENPLIKITATRGDNEYLFSFKDNGIGFDMTYAERIFQVFQRLHTRDAFPGTGIGLAICKKIVENYGGKIWVESSPGEGTVFYFTLRS